MKSSHWILFYPSNHHHRRHTFTIYNHPNTSYSSIVCYYCDDGGMKQRYMVNTHIANDIVYMCRQQTNKKLCVQQQKKYMHTAQHTQIIQDQTENRKCRKSTSNRTIRWKTKNSKSYFHFCE